MRPEDYWQSLLPPETDLPPPWRESYPARLADGRVLLLPIRTLADGSGIASLILNQAAFAVEDALADILAERLRAHGPDVVVGLPTLGLSLARAVAARLGHDRYVPLGTSRKFWYDETLSVPLSSITSPGREKRLYHDPRLRSLTTGRRVALIDDAISTGSSMRAGLALLWRVDVEPVVLGAAMLQTRRWAGRLGAMIPVEGAFHSPLLRRETDGWVLDDTG